MVKIHFGQKQPPEDRPKTPPHNNEMPIEKDHQRYLLDLMSKFAGIADRKGRVQFASEAPIRELGYTEDEILRKPFWLAEWFKRSDKSQNSIKDGISAALQGQSTRCQVKVSTKEGAPVPVTFSISPLKGQDRDVIGIIAEPKTEVQQEKADKPIVAEERTAPAPKPVEEGHFKLNATNRLTMASPSAAKILGYESPDEIIGSKLADFWARPEDRDKYLMQLSRKTKVENYEAAFQTRDGTEISVELDVHLLFDPEGEVQGSEGMFRSTTPIQEAPINEEQVSPPEESDDLYEAVIDNIGEGVALLENGIVEFANARLAQMLGYSRSDLEGTAFAQYLSQGSAIVVEQLELGEEAPTAHEIEIIRKDGEVLPVQVTAHHLEYDEVTVYMLVLRDISETETVLEQGEESYVEVLDKLDCGVVIVKDEDICLANSMVYELIGCTIEELEAAEEGEGFSMIKDFLGQETFTEIVERHQRREAGDDAPWVMQFDIVDSNDTPQTMKLSGSAIRHQGDPAELILFRNTVDEQLALEETRKSEEYLKTVLSSTGAAIVVIDPATHTIVDANANAVELIGIPQDQLLGQSCHSYICPAQSGQCPVTDLKLTMKLSKHTLPKPDGDEIPILRTVSQAAWQDHTYLIESLIDISHLDEAEVPPPTKKTQKRRAAPRKTRHTKDKSTK
jgi:PAS domain S-box-containing protein